MPLVVLVPPFLRAKRLDELLFGLELPLFEFEVKHRTASSSPTHQQVGVGALLIQFFLYLQAPQHQGDHKSTHTSHQPSQVYIWGKKLGNLQVVMATPGGDRAGPPPCTAGGLGPTSGHWLHLVSHLRAFKVCCWCPFRIMLGAGH